MDKGSAPQWLRERAPSASITRRERSLLDQAHQALELEFESRHVARQVILRTFLRKPRCQSDPKSHYFERGTSKLTLSITANPEHGLPYGGLPRLLLAWMCTEAVRTGSPELSMGRSQREFLERLDLHTGGNYIAGMHDQSLRLVHSRISVSGTDGYALGIENILIAERAFISWNKRHTDQHRPWNSTLTLSTDFFKSLVNAPVPIKIEALQALKKSPLVEWTSTLGWSIGCSR